jgi:LysR family hydrogen peroxide-inducible transcriptional activator
MSWAPHPFTLRQLQYVVAVADTRNFRRAAELCRVAQPSLSAQLAQMEDVLGVRLFERGRTGVLLTQAGEEVLARARRLLTEADDFVEAARRVADPFAGQLRLGVIPTISPYLLPEIVPALSKALPKANVLWTEDKTDTLVAELEKGKLDGAILALEARLGDLEHEVLGSDPFVLAVPPGDPLSVNQDAVTLDDLAATQVLLLDDGHCLRDQALAVCAKADVREADFRATSLSTLVQMVAAGSGVTLLPKLAVPTETRRSDVAIRPFSAPPPARTIALVWRRGGARAIALGKVAEVVRAAVWPAAPNASAPAVPARVAAATRSVRAHARKARPAAGRRAPKR